ncbi:MAG: hypothetical protein R3F30_15915 [Planctomycetota bacterium]
MRRFESVTPELSVIRERHRLVLTLLRLDPGAALSRAADLARDELPEAIAACGGGPAFTNGRGSLRIEATGDGGTLLGFTDPGLSAAECRLDAEGSRRLAAALAELGRPRDGA